MRIKLKDVSGFKNVIKTAKSLNSILSIVPADNYILFYAKSPTSVSLMEAVLKINLLDKSNPFAIDTIYVSKAIENMKEDVEISRSEDKLIIQDFNRKYTFPIMEANLPDMKGLNSLKYDVTFKVSIKTLAEYLDDMIVNNTLTPLTFTFDKDILVVSANDNSIRSEFKIPVTLIEVKNKASANYSHKFLMEFIKPNKDADEAIISFSPERPMLMKFIYKEPIDLIIASHIAPMVM